MWPPRRPCAQRTIGEDANPVPLGVRNDLGFDVAPEQVVGQLQCLHREHSAELGDLAGVEIGHTDMADLALGHERSKGRGRVHQGVRGSGQWTW